MSFDHRLGKLMFSVNKFKTCSDVRVFQASRVCARRQAVIRIVLTIRFIFCLTNHACMNVSWDICHDF